MSYVANISLRSIGRNLTRQFHVLPIRGFSTKGDSIDDNESSKTNASNDYLFGPDNNEISKTDVSNDDWRNNSESSKTNASNDDLWNTFGGLRNGSSHVSFLRKLDMLETKRSSSALNKGLSDVLGESSNSLDDGMDGKLKKAGTYFEFDPNELAKDDYSFRPDMRFFPGGTYTVKDLDLRKPGVPKSPKPQQFDVTTKEVLKKADFRNVRFLANFITEAGIIHKRSQTGIRAKAQRKIAREIKTARAFGLMPFTTMGTKSFVFGRSMGNHENDFTYQTFGDEYVDGDQTFDDPAAKDENYGRKRSRNAPINFVR